MSTHICDENTPPVNQVSVKSLSNWLTSSKAQVESTVLQETANYDNCLAYRSPVKTEVNFQTPEKEPQKAVLLEFDPIIPDISIVSTVTDKHQEDPDAEEWSERTSVITKIEHKEYIEAAQDIISDIIDSLPDSDSTESKTLDAVLNQVPSSLPGDSNTVLHTDHKDPEIQLRTMDGDDCPASPPLPRGSYNFNFDDFDENTNPFGINNKSMSENPFQASSKMTNSPPSTRKLNDNNNISNDASNEPSSENSMVTLENNAEEISGVVNSVDNPAPEVHTQDEENVKRTPKQTTKKSPRKKNSKSSPRKKKQETKLQTDDDILISGQHEQLPEPVEKSLDTVHQSDYIVPGQTSDVIAPVDDNIVEDSKPQETESDKTILQDLIDPSSNATEKNNNTDSNDAVVPMLDPTQLDVNIKALSATNDDNSGSNGELNQEADPSIDSGSERFFTPTEELLKEDVKTEFVVPELPAPDDLYEPGPQKKPEFAVPEVPVQFHRGAFEEEEFKPANEVFSDPTAWDMLEKFGSTSDNVKASTLARDSLYVKFDPLVKGASPGLNRLKAIKQTLAPISQGDDLLLMNTPPAKQPSSRLSKHPTSRLVKNEPVSEEKHMTPSPSDKIDPFAFSPQPIKEELNTTAAEVNTSQGTSLRDSMTSSSADNIVQVLKYSESEVSVIKQQMELDFQAKLLAKDRMWDKKVKQGTREITRLQAQVDELQRSNAEMQSTVTEFEKTISQAILDRENTQSVSTETVDELVKERDQALEDLQSVEKSFCDLHRRFEKLKITVDGYKKNETILKQCVKDMQNQLKEQDEKCQDLVTEAEAKVVRAKSEAAEVEKTCKGETARLHAALKKSELQCSGLESNLEQKISENKQLTAICDELIAKVGS